MAALETVAPHNGLDKPTGCGLAEFACAQLRALCVALLICTWTGGEERQLDTGEDASDSVTRATIEKARRTVQKTRFYAQDSLGSRAGTFSENILNRPSSHTAHVNVHAMKCRRVSLQLIRKQNPSREKDKEDPLVADTRMYHTL